MPWQRGLCQPLPQIRGQSVKLGHRVPDALSAFQRGSSAVVWHGKRPMWVVICYIITNEALISAQVNISKMTSGTARTVCSRGKVGSCDQMSGRQMETRGLRSLVFVKVGKWPEQPAILLILKGRNGVQPPPGRACQLSDHDGLLYTHKIT